MTDEEEIALKAACVQAAATLIATRDTGKDKVIDAGECARIAGDLYTQITAMDWQLGKHVRADNPRANRVKAPRTI
jgi:hypothetical protein